MIQARVLFVFLTMATLLALNDASMCKPRSTFKMDCNKCTCSENGKEYSCTTIKCSPVDYKQHFEIERTKEGYIILTPKVKAIDQSDKDAVFTSEVKAISVSAEDSILRRSMGS